MSNTSLDNKYSSSFVEEKWYKHWIEKNYFHADSNSKKEPYTIVIPPPNVTGMLTVGHVLNNTIQDILIRKASCLLYTSPSPRDRTRSRMPSSA